VGGGQTEDLARELHREKEASAALQQKLMMVSFHAEKLRCGDNKPSSTKPT
jgi:hypothetical protein